MCPSIPAILYGRRRSHDHQVQTALSEVHSVQLALSEEHFLHSPEETFPSEPRSRDGPVARAVFDMLSKHLTEDGEPACVLPGTRT